jgi:lipopolysaccharide biosynthesis glycosyltransferase
MDEVIQLVSAADEKFAPGLITALASAVGSASGKFGYHVSVIDGGLLAQSWERLESCLQKIGKQREIPVSLERIAAASLMTSDLPMRRGSQLTYARLVIPHFLKASKLVYMDSDVLCLRGIEAFWTNLTECAVVATRDPLVSLGRDSFARKHLSREKRGLPYFNAGIIGINCERWRSQENHRKIREFLLLSDEFHYADQSLLNTVFHDDWKEIPDLNNQVLTLRNCANVGSVDPAVNFHHVGPRKPWLSRESSLYRYTSDLLFDRFYEWVSGVTPSERTVQERSMVKVRKKALWYRYFYPSRGREYAKILGSMNEAERHVDRLWLAWLARLDKGGR